MFELNPDLVWYVGESSKKGLPPRCPFATVERCPRFYQSLSLLGQAGATKIPEARDKELKAFWANTDLWPVTDEQATSISGSDRWMFHNFCPEVAHQHSRFFASQLIPWSDEEEKERYLDRVLPGDNSFRWNWKFVEEMHYSNCPLYSLLPYRIGGESQHLNPTMNNLERRQHAINRVESAINQTFPDAAEPFRIQEDFQRWVARLSHPLRILVNDDDLLDEWNSLVSEVQYWEDADLESWRTENTPRFQALVDWLSSILSVSRAQGDPNRSSKSNSIGKGTRIFIGHGGSRLWKDLKDFIVDDLQLPYDEFNREPVAGVHNVERLRHMLSNACFAFLVMTGEDEHTDGSRHARANVIHEAGLFQGHLGFEKAIILLEDGCEDFSNIDGLGQIRFPKGNILAKTEEIRRTLKREGIIKG